MDMIALSAVIFLVLIWGRSFGFKNRKIHMRVTSVAVTADICLVLFLALHRDVLSKIGSSMSPLLVVHILLALSVVVAYFFATYYGIQLGKGNEQFRNKMKFVDRLIIPARALVLVTILIIKLTK